MKQTEIMSFGKINLSLNVLSRLESGYHQVEMVMQQIRLHDDVTVSWLDSRETGAPAGEEAPVQIRVSADMENLPVDERNLAYQAAMMMAEQYGQGREGKLCIGIHKRIPLAAGLAGGSGNGAAVLHGINRLWGLGLTVPDLCRAGSRLGSDVPFSIMGQAKANPKLGLSDDPQAAHCAAAEGTGTELRPVTGLKSYLLLTKPPLAVSTEEAYQGLDPAGIRERPDLAELIRALEERNDGIMKKNMINVLENFTLKRYPTVMYTKNKVKELLDGEPVLMSGSGPTIFALCRSKEAAQKACREMRKINRETFWTETTY